MFEKVNVKEKETEAMINFLKKSANLFENKNDGEASENLEKVISESISDNLKIAYFKAIYDNDEINWNNNEDKYYLKYNIIERKYIIISASYTKIPGVIYFTNSFIADMCADWLNYSKDVEND